MEVINRRDLCRLIPDGSVAVEIGTLFGAGAALALSNSNAKAFYTIDKWGVKTGGISKIKNSFKNIIFEEIAKAQLRPFKNCHILKLDSVEAADEFPDKSVSWLFVDGDHSYGGVHRDLKAWIPKMKPGGIIAGHDYNRAEVKKAVDEFLTKVNVTIDYPVCFWKTWG